MKIESKIEKFLNENTAHKQVELTDNPNRRAISDAWPDGVFYNGQRIFDPYIKAIDMVESNIKKRFPGDMKEVFLGYSPSSETFIMGFDYWEDKDEEEDPDRPGYILDPGLSSIYIPLHFDGNVFNTFGRPAKIDSGFYSPNKGQARGSTAYEIVHSKYSDLIDIRLD